MPAETVTLDRESLVDLLVDAYAVEGVVFALVPSELDDFVSGFVRDVYRKAEAVAESAFGRETESVREELWRRSDERAKAENEAIAEHMQSRLAAAPLSIQLIAANLVEREVAARKVARGVAEALGEDEDDG